MIKTTGDKFLIPVIYQRRLTNSASKKQPGTMKLCGRDHICDRKSEKQERVTFRRKKVERANLF